MKLILSLSLILVLIPSAAAPPPHDRTPAKHFVLVHGACHGAWSWFRLAALIKASGNNVTALDMTTSGIDPVQVGDVEDSISDYFYPLRKFMASIPANERVILVGHSYGGMGIAQAMEEFPEKIAVAVFIAAAMIGPQLNASAIGEELEKYPVPELDNYVIFGNGTNNPPTALGMGPEHMAKYLYQLSPTEDLALATMLVRPLYIYSEEGIMKELVLTPEKYGSVSRVFIVTGEDRNPGKEYQEWIVKKNPPNEWVEIAGADHMVMNSKPVELLLTLLDVANRYS